MVIFNNWTLLETGGVLAYQYDNKTRVLLVSGDLPDGWTWDMLVSVDGNLDIIRLSPMEGGVGVVLTAEMLALPGYYVMQLRGTQGELVRHTNQMTVFIPPSLSGDANWPEIPSEFTQLEQRVNETAEHYPQIGEDDTWLTYDVESGTWTDTGVSAVGQKGEPGEPGGKGDTGATPNLTIGTVETLEAGSDATASITGTVEDPILNLGIPRGENGGGGVQSDWNVNDDTDLAYVKNRPCYEETITEITWDGDTEGLVSLENENWLAPVYKVSDVAITADNIIGGKLTLTAVGNETTETSTVSIDADNVKIQDGMIAASGGVVVIVSDESISEPGVYFLCAENEAGKGWISCISFEDSPATVMHPMDSKFVSELQNSVSGLQTSVDELQSAVIAIPNARIDTIWNPPPYLTFSAPDEFSIAVSYPEWNGTMEYSTDTINWNEWDGSKISGTVLYLRGTGNTHMATDGGSLNKWTLTGTNITCEGNIENLLDYKTVAVWKHPSMDKYCFHSIFKNCEGLITAPELPATTLADACYGHMFYGCTNLKTAPELPATTLEPLCYYSMFVGCTSLIKTPDLPATTLERSCYSGMFSGCDGLTIIGKLPAAALGERCYIGMFSGCDGLISVPNLPATVLEQNCYYNMFSGCTSIKLSRIQTDEYTQEYRIPMAGDAIAATNALKQMFYGTGGTFTGTPEINTTYYLHKDCTIV